MDAFTELLGQPDEAAPDPLSTPATQVPAKRPTTAFDRMLDGPSPRDAALGSNLLGAASTTPDAHQKAIDIGGTIGAPADAVAANMQESERLARLQRYRDALNDAPKLAKLLAEDPDLAKISADDLKVLGDTESTLGRIMSAFYGVTPEAGDTLADIGRALPAGGLEGTGIAMEGVAALNDVIGRTAARGYRAVGLDALGDLADPATRPWWLNPSAIFGAGGTELRDVGKAVGPDEDRQNIATDIAGGLGQVAAQIATALLTGGAASTASMFAQGAGILAERVEEQGKTGTAEGDAAIVMGASVTALTEKMGLDALLHRVPPAIRNGILRTLVDIGIGGGIEAVQEVSEGILHNLIAMVTIDPNAKLLEGVEQDATAAGGTGAVIRALVNAATKGRQISSNVQKQQRAGQDAATVEALVTGTADSKLRDRNPDAFAAVMAAQTQGTPVETFYVPAEKLMELFQRDAPSAEEQALAAEWAAIGDAVPGLREQFQEALAVGGDVEISAADYLTHIAPTDLHGRLKNDIRASRDGWSVNDAKAYAEDPAREADLQALVERLALQNEGAAVGQATFDDVYKQLMDTGRYESHQAAAHATLLRERYIAQAAARGAGEDPDALYLRDQVRISGPGALARVRRGDLDVVIARLKSGETVQAAKTPVLDIVRKAGGVKLGSQLDSELRAMGVNPKTHPGLFKKTGGIGDVDNFVLSEHDVLRDNGVPDSGNGYADRDAVLEALRREAGGRGAALLTQDEREQRARLDEPVSVLAEQLEAAGLDVNAMTADEIKAWATGQQAAVPADAQGVLLQATGPVDETAAGKVADRFGLTVDEIRDLIGTPVADLKERDRYMAPSNGEEPVTDAPVLPMGSAKIGLYGPPENAYVEVLREFDPNDLISTEHEQDIRRHQTFDRYVGWYRQGLVPPPLFVAESDTVPGRLLTTNRRRALAAQEAGVASVPGWYSPHNKETGLPLKYGDVMRAYAEAAPAGSTELFQSAPVILSGDELGDPHVDYQATLDAAHAVYAGLRAGGPVQNVELGPVGFSARGEGKTFSGMGPTKLRLIAGLREIVEQARRNGDPQIPKDPKERDNVRFYHPMATQVRLGGRDLTVTFFVREDNNGSFHYGLWFEDETRLEELGRDPEGLVSDRDGPLEQNIGAADDGLNLTLGQSASGNGVRGSFTPKRAQDPYSNPANIIRLTEGTNLSTALHEFGHFFLFQLIDDATLPGATAEARVKLQADLQTVLDHLGIKIDVATASADQIHAAMTREAHELWARSFEVYAREGKAPSAALRDAFASFASWLVRIYRTLRDIPDYRKKLTPEVRGVMERLLATEDAIKDAQASSSFRVPSALRSVLTAAEQKSLERLTAQANMEAREELTKRVMKELERERLEWWREERAKVRERVEADVRSRPAYAAYNLLRNGVTASGEHLVDENGDPRKLKLDRNLLELDYGKDITKLLPKGVTAKEGGISHHVFAGMMGFGSADELRNALLNIQPMKEVVEAETDAAMKQRHGDMLSDGRIAEDASEVVLNEKQLELAGLQARALRRLAASVMEKAATRTVAETGAKSAAADRAAVLEAQADEEAVAGMGVPAAGVAGVSAEARMAAATAQASVGQRTAQRAALRQTRGITSGLDVKAITAAAKKAIAGKRVEDAVPGRYRAQADRLGRQIEQAIAKRDYQTAATLKEQQLINLALAKEAQEAQASVGKAVKRFARLRKPDSKLAGATDIEFVGAARAILARFGLSSPQVGFDQQTWYQRLAEDDPAGAVDMQQMIEAATAGAGTVAARGRTRTRAKPGGAPVARGDVWRQMTIDEFRSLADTVDALLHMGRDARSVQIEGERVAIKAAVTEMLAQASGRDSGKRIGQTEAVTPWEKKARSFWATAAFLERVESWARRMDDGKVGPFTKYLLRPVLAAVYEYRAEKTRRIKQLVDILEPRKAELLGKPIHSDELNYTFQNKGALLHALLHSGNDSNFRKLLLGGRGKGFAWGKANADGSLDTSRWDNMIRRMVQEGILTKADYDTAQAIWDLLEELKGPAQIAHRKMKGFYFQEVETPGIQTPFGRYRGGYVPAVSDKLLNPEAGARVDANAMGDMANAGILPSVARGFTKSRVEYNQPLELNVSKLTGHMDTVLKFTHLGPVIRDVTRLVINREFRSEMFGIDPHAIDEVLVPWLQRVSRQTTEIPFTSEGARTFGKFFKALQKHTGIAAMAGNFLNAAQQITGLSVAMVEVRPTRVLRGLVASVGAPRQSARMIMAKSAFMKDRMDNSTHELMTTLDDLLTDKSRFRKLRDKTDKHAYFAQIYTQNLVDRAVWLGGYEQGIAKGLTDAEAVLSADAVVRQTQGSFAPEDVSRVEVQNAFARPFVQFYSFFNAQLNFLRTKFDSTVQELGWVGGSPRLFYIYVMGAMVPAVLADAMMQAATGQLGDDDDDGLIDDIGELFAMSQLRYFAAMVPGVGTAVNFGIHLANDKPYDDRLSVAPVVSQAERIGGTIVKLAEGKESTTGRAVQDALMLISMLTGLPLAQIGKPLGYFTDVATGEQEGETVGDWLRGTLTGREAQKQ